MITELGKTDSAYYVESQSETVTQAPESKTQPLWFGRLVIWPDRTWYHRSEAIQFSSEHESERARDSAAHITRLAR